MAAPFTDKQVRDTLAAMVVTQLGEGPKVYPYNCLNYRIDKDGKPDFGEWPGAFTYGEDGDNIHGWVIKRTARDAEIRENGCEDLSLFYDVWGFYKFDAEPVEDPADTFTASDDVFGAIVDGLAESFNQSSIILVNDMTVLNYGLQFPSLTVMRAGQQFLHFAGGQIQLFYQT